LGSTSEFNKGKNVLKWESISVSPSATNFTFDIEMKLREEEWMVPEWSPIHLSQLLQNYYFKDNIDEVSAMKVFQDCAHYLYMPRLVNDRVFINAISQGIQSEDYFGFAAGKQGDKYLGFSFGKNTPIMLDDNCLLIKKEVAAEYKEKTMTKDPGTILPGSDPILPGLDPLESEPTTSGGKPKRFYGTIDIDPITATMTFSSVVNEVVQNFTSKPGSKVTISVEIQAALEDGYDENLRRTVKENCNVLKFKSVEFEE
jgi:uncharacterized protein